MRLSVQSPKDSKSIEYHRTTEQLLSSGVENSSSALHHKKIFFVLCSIKGLTTCISLCYPLLWHMTHKWTLNLLLWMCIYKRALCSRTCTSSDTHLLARAHFLTDTCAHVQTAFVRSKEASHQSAQLCKSAVGHLCKQISRNEEWFGKGTHTQCCLIYHIYHYIFQHRGWRH